MRFIVLLGMAVGLASAAAMSPIERRQCSTQRDGCCLKQGTCQTCYFGSEPYDCNCECLEHGLCPCTGYYHGECFSWYSPDGHVRISPAEGAWLWRRCLRVVRVANGRI